MEIQQWFTDWFRVVVLVHGFQYVCNNISSFFFELIFPFMASLRLFKCSVRKTNVTASEA